MKTVLQQIIKAAKARVQKNVRPQSRQNPAYKLNPAPAYWLLQPVQPQEIVSSKNVKNYYNRQGM